MIITKPFLKQILPSILSLVLWYLISSVSMRYFSISPFVEKISGIATFHFVFHGFIMYFIFKLPAFSRIVLIRTLHKDKLM